MKTYSVHFLDSSRSVDLPSSIRTMRDAIILVNRTYAHKSEVRVCETHWEKTSTIPHIVKTGGGVWDGVKITEITNYFNGSDSHMLWDCKDVSGYHLKVTHRLPREHTSLIVDVEHISDEMDYLRECMVDSFDKKLPDEVESPIGLWAKQLVYRDRNQRMVKS